MIPKLTVALLHYSTLHCTLLHIDISIFRYVEVRYFHIPIYRKSIFPFPIYRNFSIRYRGLTTSLHCTCTSLSNRSARSPPWRCPRWRRRHTRTVSRASTACSGRCGRVSGPTAARGWRRSSKPSASSSPSWTPRTLTTTRGR